MDNIRVTDEAEFKSDLRKMYRDIGYQGMLQVFYEMVIGAQFCLEVIKEELDNEKES